MDEDMFRRRGGPPIRVRLAWLYDDVTEWWEENWEAITPWFMAVVGAVLLSATFIV